jgi:DNA-binding NarL/FixJ family response regulator
MNHFAQIQKTSPPMPAASVHGWGDGPALVDTCVTDTAPAHVHERNTAQTNAAAAICVGLIDCHSFSRDCLVRAFAATQQEIVGFPFQSVQELVASRADGLDVVMYYAHAEGSLDLGLGRDITALRNAIAELPIVVLSDAVTATEAATISNALKAGIRGFIPTRTIEMSAVAAAIRFVMAGGTFAPVDLLLGGGCDPTSPRKQNPPIELLTPRQLTVLELLRLGKANKIIAYELGMSESTVKVHIRNIMRRTGATNRTQAVYKVQQLASGANLVASPGG